MGSSLSLYLGFSLHSSLQLSRVFFFLPNEFANDFDTTVASNLKIMEPEHVCFPGRKNLLVCGRGNVLRVLASRKGLSF